MGVCRRMRCATVHPRLCGEHDARRDGLLQSHGSSPPVRGTLGAAGSGNGADRFIPACAGNTFGGYDEMRLETVHPRLCGEHTEVTASATKWNGSSPPVRGTLEGAMWDQSKDRFIPACAGNTTESSFFYPTR